ncbi:MAG: outer membrane beta-barrel protein [Bacteroidetes bacterium]|nr:outer membrane beta-barrel protein [Bacteroidota bacterium]MDA1268291.1 outer membrane beta-barrel protein [Bacteroidota bacterium]
MKYLFLTIALFFVVLGLQAQTYSLKGTVLEAGKSEPIAYVNILLLRVSDSTQVAGTISEVDGQFEIKSIKEGIYLFKIQYLGYQILFRTLDLQSDTQLGILFLREEEQALSEVVVAANRAAGAQKRDTTLYNADAFRTMKDASAQVLIEKLPGVVFDGGVLQAQGENITQILVDGKPFFGTDVRAALQNLPAEVIQSIEIFDQKSEKSQVSGFDDGERLKTINIITKVNRRKGQFGKTTAGYGNQDRYLTGTSINAFDEDQRLTFTGLANNVNLLTYSSDAATQSQGEGRPQEGIVTTSILGLNYSNQWGTQLKITGNYGYTKNENIGLINRVRDFVTSDQSDVTYTEEAQDIRTNHQHVANIRLEYNPNDKTRILYIPRLSANIETENSSFFGKTSDKNTPINQVENQRIGKYDDYDFFNRFIISRKFNTLGRSLSWRSILHRGWNRDESTRLATSLFFQGSETRSEMLNQQTQRERFGTFWETGLSYTEKLGKNGQLEIEYEVGNRTNDSDQRVYNRDKEDFGLIEELDTLLTNVYFSDYLTQETELGYQYSTEKLKFQTELQYQSAKLDNRQEFPKSFQLERNFSAWLPTLRLEYKFNPNTNIQVDYDTQTAEPSIWQLQPVINNTNPLQLRVGNPDLDQSYSQEVRLRFRSQNPDSDRSWFLFTSSSLTNRFISNSTLIASQPITLVEGITLQKGAQLLKPVNLDGFWEMRSWASYGMPLEFIKSKLNISAGGGLTRRPGQVNDRIGFTNSQRLSTGLSIASSISENLDFNLSSRSSFNRSENTLNPNLNTDFFQQRFRLNFNWIIWQGIIYRLDLNHQINSGLNAGFNTNFSLVNMSLGKKVFKNQRGEVSIMIYDLLNQNANVRRNISDTFIEDIQTNVLQQYFMLSFTYNIRRFSKGMDEEAYKEM